MGYELDFEEVEIEVSEVTFEDGSAMEPYCYSSNGGCG